MKYAFIAEHIRQFKVTTMTRILGVARSGFYAWRTRQGMERFWDTHHFDRGVCSGQVKLATVL